MLLAKTVGQLVGQHLVYRVPAALAFLFKLLQMISHIMNINQTREVLIIDTLNYELKIQQIQYC